MWTTPNLSSLRKRLLHREWAGQVSAFGILGSALFFLLVLALVLLLLFHGVFLARFVALVLFLAIVARGGRAVRAASTTGEQEKSARPCTYGFSFYSVLALIQRLLG